MPKKIKIIVADDHELVRQGFISLLKCDSRISVIGEAENGRLLLDLIKLNEPDIVLVDLEMPVMNGAEALTIIKKRFPHIGVIIVSMHYTSSLVSEYLARGAGAYLYKNVTFETLLDAIDSVKAKGQYFDQAASNAMLHGLKAQKGINSALDELCLTEREIDVLKLLCKEKTNKEVGAILSITPSTVDFHRRNIYSKTKCKNIAGLVKYAIRNGIIPPNTSNFHTE